MRLPDWELRLHDYIAGLVDVAFGYDHTKCPEHVDCCVFAAGAVEAITGADPMSEFRGRYCTQRSAASALKQIGRGTLLKTLDGKFVRVAPAFAQRGDLAGHGGSIGVVIGADALFVGDTDGTEGLIRVPRASWARAWKVD